MKYQALFYMKNKKKNITSLSSAVLTQGVGKVNPLKPGYFQWKIPLCKQDVSKTGIYHI